MHVDVFNDVCKDCVQRLSINSYCICGLAKKGGPEKGGDPKR